MAMSKRGAPTRNLVAFCEWAKANGFSVGEMPPYGHVHPVHSKGSFHYDTDGKYGQAADINYPRGGSLERMKLTLAAVIAQSMGLGILYGRDGYVAGHSTHAHVDIGSYTNLGRGLRKRTAGNLVVWDTQPSLHVTRDNLSGDETVHALDLLRAASNYGGVEFPDGVEATQEVVGTKEDDIWGDNSRASHDASMHGVQVTWKAAGLYKGKIDDTWGPLMDKAFTSFKKKF